MLWDENSINRLLQALEYDLQKGDIEDFIDVKGGDFVPVIRNPLSFLLDFPPLNMFPGYPSDCYNAMLVLLPLSLKVDYPVLAKNRECLSLSDWYKLQALKSIDEWLKDCTPQFDEKYFIMVADHWWQFKGADNSTCCLCEDKRCAKRVPIPDAHRYIMDKNFMTYTLITRFEVKPYYLLHPGKNHKPIYILKWEGE